MRWPPHLETHQYRGGTLVSKKSVDANNHVQGMQSVVNTAAYSAESVGVSVGMGSSTGASAGFGKDSGNATTVTQAGIGVSTSEDTTAAIKPIFDAARVQAEVSAQVQITQAFSQEAPKAVASYAGGKADELKKQAAAETDPEKKKALEAEQRKWEEGGLYRVALHTAAGALSGGASGAVGAAVSAGTAELMNDLQAATQKALQEAGLESGSAKAVAQGVAGLTAAGLGGLAGGVQGAGAALAADVNNRQLHQREYDFAKKQAKLVAEKLGISLNEAEGRIVAEILRNSDQQTAQATDGKHDYGVRSILGCQNLNCNGYKNDPNYADHSFNAQLIAPNQTAYNLGQTQLEAGQTYNQLVISNVKKDPVGTTLAGAGMVGLGVVTGGGLPTLGLMATGGTIGMTVNGGVQVATGQPFDWVSFGLSGVTGATSSGMGFVPVLLVNTGGALTGAGIKGENPNGAMAGAAIGTAVGYPIGTKIAGGLGSVLNPWYRQEWKEIGMDISTYVPKSPIPSWMGGIGSGVVQEIVGSTTQKAVENKK